MCILLGFQQYLTMFGGTMSIPFILCPLMCISENDPARGYIISTLFFVSGIVTLLQVTISLCTRYNSDFCQQYYLDICLLTSFNAKMNLYVMAFH